MPRHRMPTNPDGGMEHSGPSAVRPATEMAQKPTKETSFGTAMSHAQSMQGGNAPVMMPDPTMASKPVKSSDGLGQMAGEAGGRRKDMMTPAAPPTQKKAGST